MVSVLRGSKGWWTLGVASLTTAACIFLVHRSQKLERANLKIGVLRDDELYARKLQELRKAERE